MLSPNPFVSVVIPCLNRAHYLRPTIDSVLDQNYPNVECMVMDGGSTDGTIEILESYGDKIAWLSEPDKGHADAINKGWARSRGEILTWLNADDLWVVPNAASSAVEFFLKNQDVDLVYGDCGAIDDDGNVIGSSYVREWNLDHAVIHCDHCISQPAAFMKRAILEKVKWLDASIAAGKDHDLWLRIALYGKIKYFPVTLAYERASSGTWSDRGDLTAAGKVFLTKKFFAHPAIPDRIRHKRRRAMSNAHLKAAEYAYSGGRHRVVWAKHILGAAFNDPTNLKSVWNSVRAPVATAIVEHRHSRKHPRAC